jgi:hypothetical protein
MNAALMLLIILDSPSGAEGAGFKVDVSHSEPYTITSTVSPVYIVVGSDAAVTEVS